MVLSCLQQVLFKLLDLGITAKGTGIRLLVFMCGKLRQQIRQTQC